MVERYKELLLTKKENSNTATHLETVQDTLPELNRLLKGIEKYEGGQNPFQMVDGQFLMDLKDAFTIVMKGYHTVAEGLTVKLMQTDEENRTVFKRAIDTFDGYVSDLTEQVSILINKLDTLISLRTRNMEEQQKLLVKLNELL